MQETESLKKTPLHKVHLNLGARMVEFGGWHMPVSYTKVLDEHKHVRASAGIFDVSHMGEIFVNGKEAQYYLQTLLINDLSQLEPGKGQYTALLNDEGGMIDDLIVYQLAADSYLLCVNAGNIEKDFNWLKKHSQKYSQLSLENLSTNFSQLAIQGPTSFDCLEPFLNYQASKALSDLKYGEISILTDEQGSTFYVARTGYTGEKGYEIYLPVSLAENFWNKILATHAKSKVQPIGLGARDTLRLEACYPLYSQEMDEMVNPLEIGLSWATKIGKTPSFIGSKALLKAKEAGLKRKLYGFHLLDSGIARAQMKVYQGEQLIGYVTSGSVLPSLDQRGGLALLDSTLLDKKEPVTIDVRGQYKKAVLVKKPMYKAKTKN